MNARLRLARRRPRTDRHLLSSLTGLPALSLDALTSVAYGPEAAVLVLAAAGAGAISGLILPLCGAIAVVLAALVLAYRQIIALHPDGGGAYAVARAHFGPATGRLAAASLIVDYVLTAAVSLSTGAASLASAFPALGPHRLALALGGLVLLTLLNLRSMAETARVLMPPTLLFLAAVLGIIAVGLIRDQPAAAVGGAPERVVTEGLGVLLVLRAFSTGCSTISGIEAIANGVPAFRRPCVRTAQRTQVLLGTLLVVMLTGLAALIARHHITPRHDVTVFAQLTATAYGRGWIYTATNLIVALLLGLAANTSFGSLPVLFSVLARDRQLPHLLAHRTSRGVYRNGILTLTTATLLLLVFSGARTSALIPLFAIGIFIGFTISQLGLARYWIAARAPHWRTWVLVNITSAVVTLTATVTLLVCNFWRSAWTLTVVVGALIVLFSRTEHHYR